MQARWALFLGRFSFTLTYRPGSRKHQTPSPNNSPRTAPSLTPGPFLSPSCVVGMVSFPREARRPCAPYPALQQTVCPRTRLLRSAHSSLLVCHSGSSRIFSLQRQRFWWPAMAQDARTFISSVCAGQVLTPSGPLLAYSSLCPSPLVTHRSGFYFGSPMLSRSHSHPNGSRPLFQSRPLCATV